MNQPIQPMTERQRAELRIQREMGRRTTQSIFHEGGDLNERRAMEMTASGAGDVFLGEYLHLAGIEWAPEPDGSDHCEWLSRIVSYIAELPETWGGIVGGPLSPHDQKVLHATAMLYCTGRTVPSDTNLEGGHWEAQSAHNAEVFFRNGGGAGTYWGKPEVREDVCRLIFKNNDASEVRADKRLQVFADAVRYETARYWPNTAEGHTILKERIRPELFHTGWAKSKDNFRAWMLKRGWR